ncbi:MAG: hypothetical protein ACFE9M_13290 [Promethearchaeota archaeon]
MNDKKNNLDNFLSVKIIQSGDIIKVSLSSTNLKKKFNEIYGSLLRELKLKQKDTYLSNKEGKMIGDFDLELSLEEIIKKFGNRLKLHYEKII